MKPTIAVMSYGVLTSLIEKNKNKLPKSNLVDIEIINVPHYESLIIAQEMEKKQKADVFISFGNSLLSRYIKSPVVEIKATEFDVFMALHKAKKRSDIVVIITHINNKIIYLKEISDMFKFTIKQYTYDNNNEVEGILKQVINQGIHSVICTGYVYEIAQKLEIEPILIYSDYIVIRALETAVKIAISKKKESERAERFQMIMDFAHEGIIATDINGNITMINPMAEKIINIKREGSLGCPIQKIIPDVRLINVLQSKKPVINQLQTIGNIKIVINIAPIIVDDIIVGTVATFQDVTTIREAEEKIREKAYKKGLVAKFRLDDILGSSELIINTKKKALLYAKSDSTILITGESGTGKELFAQGIHNASNRAKRPFVAINCQALPDNLLESELFGYEEGAFTGARKGGKPGFFEIAHGGTIFLDEIGEMSPRLQSRLLRVLEEHEVMRIGSVRIIPVNIRVIAATNINLWEAVNQGKFREDLYYRLNVLELNVPPLRLRKNDIPLLVAKFLSEFRKDLKENEVTKILNHLLNHRAFYLYDWPGNIRELKNFVERFSVLFTGDAKDISSLVSSLLDNYFERQIKPDETSIEYEEIYSVLKKVRGNKTEAARKLGISRTTLWRKLKKLKQINYIT